MRRAIALLALAVAALWLAGCGTRLQAVVRADAAGGYEALDAAELGAELVVFRDGRPLSGAPPLALRPGDEIETGARANALIRFADGGEAVLGPRTRVRLGSLEVLFGRVFASVRGLFSAQSENVVADVEGTGFLFTVSPARAVRVVVLDGAVRCRARDGQWAPIRLEAGFALRSNYPNRDAPQVGRAAPTELERIRRWAEAVRAAAAPPGLPFRFGIGIGIGGGGGGAPRDRTPSDY